MPVPKARKKKMDKDKDKDKVKDQDGSKAEKVSCGKRFGQAMMSHGGLFIIVMIYSVVGAYMLISIEMPREEASRALKVRAGVDIDDSIRYITLDMWYQNSLNHTPATFQDGARMKLQVFHDFVVAVATDSRISYDGKPSEWAYSWTFSKALLFTVTTIAAIGYGHISPKTFNGKMFTIGYAVVGVPLLLVFLASIGEFLAKGFRYIYSRGCCLVCRFRRRKSEVTKNGPKPPSQFKDEVGDEYYMPTHEVEVPISINLCVITVYIMFGGVLFSKWEGWELHSAAYFSFITLSTIGFGDYVPGEAFDVSSDEALLSSAIKMIVTIMFSLFGMALLSMCINLIQEQILNKSRWLVKELGLGEDEEDPTLKYKIRRSGDNVMTTAADKDGNKKYHLKSYENERRNKDSRKKLLQEDFD